MSGKYRFVVQVSSELPSSEGYEKVPTDEPSDRLVSCEADDIEILSDQVSPHCSCIKAADEFHSIYCLVVCNVFFMLVNRLIYF
jgi:hypothetical protein